MSARANKIRPVRKTLVSKRTDDFEKCWETLRNALEDIHKKNLSQLSFEQLYRASYKIVLDKKGEQLYDRVKTFEKEWFCENVMPKIASLVTGNLVNMALLRSSSSASVSERRQTGEKFLNGVRDSWEDHRLSMNMVADVLMYLDRAWSHETKRPFIYTATIGLYRDHLLRWPMGGTAESDHQHEFVIFDVLYAVIRDLIDMERNGDIIDRSTVRKIVTMLEELYETDEELEDQKLYLTAFEVRYLADSRNFYHEQCQELLREPNAGHWLRHTQRCLAEEVQRCETTTSPLTAPKIARVVEDELISAHIEDFLALEGSGLRVMIDEDHKEELTILYQLMSRVDDAKTPLQNALQVRVRDDGRKIERDILSTDFSAPPLNDDQGAEDGEKSKVLLPNAAAQQTAAAIQWVDEVLKLKDRFDNLLSECFQQDLILQSAIIKSFHEFINLFARSSEFVSLFIDDTLKRGVKGKTEAEIDVLLNKAIVLLKHLRDKDIFERYYQKHLAKRLLHGKSESQDIENDMISRMKDAMGKMFTVKFEGMFKDMELSRDLTEGYQEHIRSLGDADASRIQLSVHVLTTNNWPPEVMGRGDDGAKSPCDFPPAIQRIQESFYKYYLKDRSGRRLTWVPTAGSADIKCTFPRFPGKDSGPLSRERRYDLNVSTYGMLILMLVNELAEGETISFEHIQKRTNIPANELLRALMSLSVAPRSKVLIKEPAGGKVRPGDTFAFNASFVSKTIKIKAPTVNSTSRVEDDDERTRTRHKNDQTRMHMVDAAIVRIMKQRKLLTHNQLTSEVISQLASRFQPEIAMIKKRVEDLISREYLDRVEGQMATYRYLA